MRSMFSYAALLAAVTMTGCCGTGNCCLSHGLFGGRDACKAPPVQYDTMEYETSGDCGCGCDGAVSDASWDGVASGEDYGMVAYTYDCGGDCGCQSTSSGTSACEACGDDAVVSVSAPFDCGDAGCGCGASGSIATSARSRGPVRRVVSARKTRATQSSTSMNFSDAGVSCDSCGTGDCGSGSCGSGSCGSGSCGTGDCGYGCAPGGTLASVRPCDEGCNAGTAQGCDSCGSSSCDSCDSSYARASAGSYSGCDSCGGCDSCSGAKVVSTPSEKIRCNKGLGLFMKSHGKMCGSKKDCCGCWLFGKRKLKKVAASTAYDGGCGCGEEVYGDTEYVDEGYAGCDSCDNGCEACETLSASQDAGGRRISNGIIADIKEMSPRVAAHRGIASRGGLHGPGSGCGVDGCGTTGLCHRCAGAHGPLGAAHPYGGATPHTRPQPGQSGMAPTQMYPYYTTRGPRDFLRDNPPSIGY